MRGLTFPFILNGKGGIDWSTSLQDLVKTNLKAILSWPQGNRFYLPQFGTRLNELLETEPNDDVLISMIPSLIVEPIALFEPRIKILDLKIVKKTDEAIMVHLDYVITESNSPDSFTYPFYTTPKN